MRVRLSQYLFSAMLAVASSAHANGIWDGVYVGSMDPALSQSSGRACGGGWIKRIRVHNNVFIFPYNEAKAGVDPGED